MKSKLTLSINKEAINKANELSPQENSNFSQLGEDSIENKSEIDKKLRAMKRTSGVLDVELEEGDRYFKEIHKKHGWQ